MVRIPSSLKSAASRHQLCLDFGGHSPRVLRSAQCAKSQSSLRIITIAGLIQESFSTRVVRTALSTIFLVESLGFVLKISDPTFMIAQRIDDGLGITFEVIKSISVFVEGFVNRTKL